MVYHTGLIVFGVMVAMLLSVIANHSGQKFTPEKIKDVRSITIVFPDSNL